MNKSSTLPTGIPPLRQRTAAPGTTESHLGCDKPFKSLGQLREEHGQLLQQRTDTEDDEQYREEFLSGVEAFIDRVLATGAILEAHEDREAAQAVLNFWSNYLYRVGRELGPITLANWDANVAQAGLDLTEEDYPYPRLDQERDDQQKLFLDRTEIVDECIRRVRDSRKRLLVICGPESSGRHTLVNIGIIPALRAGAVEGSDGWRFCSTVRLNSDVLAQLARSLFPGGDDIESWCHEQVAEFRNNSNHLRKLLDEPCSPTVLVIERFERVFGPCEEADSRAFVENVNSLFLDPPTQHTVILIMNSDYLEEIVKLGDFRPIFEQVQVRLKPFESRGLIDAIQQPADQKGLQFEEGLVDQLVVDVLGDPAGVPLLLIHLRLMWERRRHNWITWNAYLSLGGAHMLERSLDEVYSQSSPAEQETMRKILMVMVRPSVGRDVVCASASAANLHAIKPDKDQVDAQLAKLVATGLVRKEPEHGPRYSLTHRGLAFHWRRLMKWLDDESMARRTRVHLTATCEQWVAEGRDAGALWTSPHMVEEASQLTDPPHSPLEIEFLEQCRKTIEHEERAREAAHKRELKFTQDLANEHQRRKEIFRMAAFALGIAAVLLTISLGVTWYFKSQADKNHLEANENLVKVNVTRGINLQARDDTPEALLWFAEGRAKAIDTRQEKRGDRLLGAHFRQLPRLVRIIQLEERSITKVAADATLSPDGRIVATAYRDRIELREVESGKKLQCGSAFDDFEIQADMSFRSVRFSPNGRFLLVTCQDNREQDNLMDGTVYGWTVPKNGDWSQLKPFDLPGTDDTRGTCVRYATFGPGADAPEDCLLTISAKAGTNDAEFNLWRNIENAGASEQTWTEPRPPNLVRLGHQGKYMLTITFSGENDQSGALRIRRIADPNTVDEQPFMEWGARDAALSPYLGNGTYLVVAIDTGALLWRFDAMDQGTLHLDQPHFVARLPHNSSVYSVDFSPDWRRVITGSRDRKVRVWDTMMGEPVFPPMHHDGTVSRVSFAKDKENRLCAVTSNSTTIWDLTTINPRAKLSVSVKQSAPNTQKTSNKVQAASLSRHGRFVAVSTDNLIEIWNRNSCEFGLLPEEMYTTTQRLCFDANGIGIGDSSEFEQRPEGIRTTMQQLRFDPNNKRLAIVTRTTTSAKSKNDATQEDAAPGIAVWDIVQKMSVDGLSQQMGLVDFATFSHDGSTLLTIAKTQDEGDTRKGIVTTWGFEESPPVAIRNGEPFEVWESRFEELDPKLHSEPVLWAAFGPKEPYIVTASVDDDVKIWRLTDENERYVGRLDDSEGVVRNDEATTHTANVNCVAFSRDGKLLLTGSADRTAKLWEWTSTGDTPQVRLKNSVVHDNLVTYVAFNDDGTRFVTVGRDRRAKVWDVDTAVLLADLPHDRSIHHAVFDSAGETLLTVSALRPDARMGQTARVGSIAEFERTTASARKWGLCIPQEEDGETLDLHILRAYSELVAGQRFDDDKGRLVPLTSEQWSTLRVDNEKRDRIPFVHTSGGGHQRLLGAGQVRPIR